MKLEELIKQVDKGPLFVQASNDKASWIIKSVLGQVIADFPYSDTGYDEALFTVHCRNNFMLALRALRSMDDVLEFGSLCVGLEEVEK